MSASAVFDDEVTRLRSQLAEAWLEIKTLRRTLAHQARLISTLGSEVDPSAPSLAIVWWLYSQVRGHEKSFKHIWWRIYPLIRRLGDLPAPELNAVVWERHRSVRRTEPDHRGNCPIEYTLNVELQRTKEMLDWAVENDMLKFNPLKPAKNVKTQCGRETRLKQADVGGLLKACEQLRDTRKREEHDDGWTALRMKAFILCCFDSMLRFNEARHLRRDIIGADGTYNLSRTTTKGGKPRTVVLTPRTLEAIALLPTAPNTHYVFASLDTGKLLGQTYFRRWFRQACKRCGIDARCEPGDKQIVIHHLRHAGASEADEAGARPGAIKDALGHSRLATTEKYLHREKTESARHVAEKMVAAAVAKPRLPPKRAALKRRPAKKSDRM